MMMFVGQCVQLGGPHAKEQWRASQQYWKLYKQVGAGVTDTCVISY